MHNPSLGGLPGLYLHSQANIMINEAGNACLSDFGLTGVVYGLDTVNPVTPGSVVPGSIRWMAPESLDPEGAGVETMSALRESDVHSFSMVAWEVQTPCGIRNRTQTDCCCCRCSAGSTRITSIVSMLLLCTRYSRVCDQAIP